ncbi:Thioesterase/thiol ester dehydrase-isomerase [Trematosphaeria pertusa]|uniref:Thioesterase/thiol ester dehydrase-isomerase n=1 Tax=Trematosphaeria pertusa TaxID=390896 RepID=A0A6A6IWH2_9PLEO|nr:Thioesterase/thiol ester dehydrase-isomerase [Trematosphaeria pertusa]KAF2254744.1 Thioesterase/thiol ester dehydrase-isomerase [Trematosphaeria pertusa]
MIADKDRPVKRPDGRYDNVDFRKAAGFKLPTVKASYLRRDVLLFANAIGCIKDELHFLYELHPNFSCFPTFPINLPFKQTDQDVYDFFKRALVTDVPGVPSFDPKRSVDGERGIEILHPIPVSSEGLDLEISPEIVGVYDKGGNMIQEMVQSMRDAKTGVVYAKMSSKAFGIGQGGYGGPRGPDTVSYTPPKRAPDAVHVFQTTPETCLLYRLCGDYNPIHADDKFAQEGGFKGAFLQGLGTWNIAAHGLLREMGGSEAGRLKSYKARFANIVYPGDALETRMWRVGEKDGVEEVIFQTVVKSDGRVALSNGFAELWKKEGKSKL